VLTYFYTTGVICLISFFLSVILAFGFYEWSVFFQIKKSSGDVVSVNLIPSLLLAPPLIALAYKFLGWNLIYPVHIYADFYDIFYAAWVPAVVLLLASGLYSGIKSSVSSEIGFWKSKSFYLFSTSLGMSPDRALRRVVLLRVLSQSWLRSLPWFFGELIVIEAVFNAPGLAYEAWNSAKLRDFYGLAEVMISIVLLYFVCFMMVRFFNRWLGEKLASYV